ncbi:MAG: rhodanese-like domain-containing protein [Actinomycetota bacterium]
MDPETLRARSGEVQILDVRWPHEWEAGHIEGALHIPVDELEDRLDEVDHGRPVVAVCRTGDRSARAAEVLRARGFEVASLEGGMVSWERHGLPIAAAGEGPGSVADPTPPPLDPELEGVREDLMRFLGALSQHFGAREPSEDEARAFMKQWLVTQKGVAPDEADRILDDDAAD